MLADKLNLCLANNITPIFCCGEALAIRDLNQQNGYVEQQLRESLFHLSKEDMLKTVIAYEPIWAIGTGKTASPDQAQAVHAFIRHRVAAQDATVAQGLCILYGGSVKAGNAPELFGMQDIDGGLIGGPRFFSPPFVDG